ncbi:MAG: T9SS type A sorting domain-containing protein, partial [Calditrichaeota bacterium]|nr:T9SS type A sorting domain-containing protein [Calditrichota bacterium]
DMKSDFLQGATLVFPHEDLDGNGSVDILGAADDGRLVAISGGTSALAIDDSPTALPSDYALSQNYPNPFNPGTVFSVSLPERADVQITVFNMLGQNVAELFNGKLAAGQHKFAFDANQLPSGVYFYRVSANQFVQTRKMLLVR